MKRIILVALLMIGTIIVAQEGNKRGKKDQKNTFTPEQRSQLMLKKMTLELDLNDAQQKDFKTIIAEKMSKIEAHKTARKAMKEKGEQPSNDDRFAMKMKMLDEQSATKKRIQKILNPQQFEKWTALKEKHNGNRMGKRHGNHKGRHDNTNTSTKESNG